MPDKTAVIVDDEASVRDFIKRVLERSGFEIIEANSGPQALNSIRDVGPSVAVLISDIQMPQMDGITLACSVRSEFPSIPIILISGYVEPEIVKHMGLNVVFLGKPFRPATLLDAVTRLTKTKTKSAGSE